MLKLEDIKKDGQIKGIEGNKVVKIVSAELVGTEAINLFYVDGDNSNDSYEGSFYIKKPFTQEPDFGVASINYDLDDLLSNTIKPEDSV